MATSDPSQKRVLIVEDDAFVALDIADLLEGAAFEIVACVSTTVQALALLETQTPDMAVLDFNLRQETSQPIADRLGELGVPYLFLSGRTREEIATDRPMMRKPFMADALVKAVKGLKT